MEIVLFQQKNKNVDHFHPMQTCIDCGLFILTEQLNLWEEFEPLYSVPCKIVTRNIRRNSTNQANGFQNGQTYLGTKDTYAL